MIRILAAVLAILTLSALPQTLHAQLAGSETCQARAERFKAAIQIDVRKRQIAEGVAKTLLPQIEQAAELCKANRTTDGDKILNAIMKKYGYL